MAEGPQSANKGARLPTAVEPPEAGPPWTGRALRLPAPPTAGHAAELAQCAVDAALNVAGIELDYTPSSLRHIDAMLESSREPGSDAMTETICVFGCYVGEVMVRNAGYEWVDTPAELVGYLGPLTVYLASTGAHASPIAKAFKRVDNGDIDSVAYFYQHFTTDTRHSNYNAGLTAVEVTNIGHTRRLRATRNPGKH